jgi:hypothetical protein
MVGMILHHRRCTSKKLRSAGRELDHLRRIHPVRSWNGENVEATAELVKNPKETLANARVETRAVPCATDCEIATDASTKGWDVMWPLALDRSLIISRTEVLCEKGTYKKNQQRGLHLRQQLRLTVLALEAACAMGFRATILLVDNTAAVAALMNGFSANEAGNSLVARADKLACAPAMRVYAIP